MKLHCEHGFPWLSRHSSLSSIGPGRSPRLHPEFAQSCYGQFLVGRPALVRPCEGVHWRTSLMNSFLLLQQYAACFIHLIWIVLEMGGKRPCSCYFLGCCFQDLFNVVRCILVQFQPSFFSSFRQRPRVVAIQLNWHNCYLQEIAFYFNG